MGEEREYLTIKILHNELTVMVPCENAGKAGLRRVIDEEEIKKVTDVLTDDVSEMPKNWNRRFKYNREKIKTGDVFELAEVVRNLAIREMEKGLSTGEKQMYTRAKKILSSEFMYALDKDEDGAEEYLDGLLEERFAATAYGRSAQRRHSGHRGRRLRGEARSRRPEGLRAAGRAADGRVVDRGVPGGGRRSARSSSPARPGTSTISAGHGHRRGRRRRDPVDSRSPMRLQAVGTELVAIHDAARPLVTPELIEGVVATLLDDPEAAGAIAATPVTDTIKRASRAALSSPMTGQGVIGSRRRSTAAVCGRRRRRRCSGRRGLREALAGEPGARRGGDRRGDAGRGGGGRVADPSRARREPQGDDAARPEAGRAAARPSAQRE